jgi:Bacteriocin-protection, YdeI or OmpD-Associated/Domain of unknown function (DUF1905)
MNRLDQDYIFAAQIQKIWIMRCIDVPRDISRAIRKSVGAKALHVPVRGWIEGLPFRNTLVPRGGGSFRMHVHSSIWRKLRIDAGAAVEVHLSLDTEPPRAILPPDLAAALTDAPYALATFNALTVAFRRQIVRYLEAAKRSQTRDKRVQLIVRRMLERVAKSRRKPKPLRKKK